MSSWPFSSSSSCVETLRHDGDVDLGEVRLGAPVLVVAGQHVLLAGDERRDLVRAAAGVVRATATSAAWSLPTVCSFMRRRAHHLGAPGRREIVEECADRRLEVDHQRVRVRGVDRGDLGEHVRRALVDGRALANDAATAAELSSRAVVERDAGVQREGVGQPVGSKPSAAQRRRRSTLVESRRVLQQAVVDAVGHHQALGPVEDVGVRHAHVVEERDAQRAGHRLARGGSAAPADVVAARGRRRPPAALRWPTAGAAGAAVGRRRRARGRRRLAWPAAARARAAAGSHAERRGPRQWRRRAG